MTLADDIDSFDEDKREALRVTLSEELQVRVHSPRTACAHTNSLCAHRVQLRELSAASFVPLWAGAHSAAQAAAAAAALQTSGLLHLGGVATTGERSGQQWDFPNAWPPLQQMLVEGLAGCGAAGGAVLAEEVALCWLRSNHRGWSRDGVMREKYDATRPGESGGGGEYAPQVCLSRRV